MFTFPKNEKLLRDVFILEEKVVNKVAPFSVSFQELFAMGCLQTCFKIAEEVFANKDTDF